MDNLENFGSILDLYKKRVSESINGQTVFITGGTGSFGQKLVNILFLQFKPKAVIIFSRDEFKQHHMRTVLGYNETKYPNLYYVIGDIRNRQRIYETLRDYGVTIVIHAAAIKHVDICEKNPTECIDTNIMGAVNLVNACKDAGVKKVLALSTDKCVDPVNIYGASKLCLERIVISSNNFYALKDDNNTLSTGPLFSVLRYGNVLGSRGSVVHVFSEQIKSGQIKVTDENMTRFTIMKEEAVNFALNCLSLMIGGEIFVPELSTYSIKQFVDVMKPHPNFPVLYTGSRPGEKVHECMISQHESHLAFQVDTVKSKRLDDTSQGSFYVIRHNYYGNYVNYEQYYAKNFGDCINQCDKGWSYASNDNKTIDNHKLRVLINVAFIDV